MKKLGLIGGMGPQSTVPYYMGIVYGVRERTNPDFFPNLTIESLNVFEILNLIGENRLDFLTRHFLKAINNLQAAGAEVAVLTANTSHIVFDRLKELSPIPLISIVESVCDEARRRSYRKIALLGTKFTMERDFYKTPFIKSGIEIVIPNESERQFIDETIVNELELGLVREETRDRYLQIIRRMRDEESIESVILGCTELPLILNDEISPIPVLDSVKIHISDIIDSITKV